MSTLSKIHYQQEEFIRKNSLQCSLFVELAERICRLLILDSENTIRSIEEIETASFLAKKWTFSNLRFSKTKVLTLPESFIFVPDELELKDAIPFTPFLIQNSQVFQQPLAINPICTHFTIDDTATQIRQQLPTSEVHPSANVLIQYMLSIASEQEEYVGINFYEKEMELVFIKNKQFIFYNRFAKETADDFNFYLLSVFEQFEIKVALAHFYLTGSIHQEDENYLRLSKYSSHLHIMKNETIDFLISEIHSSPKFFLLSKVGRCE